MFPRKGNQVVVLGVVGELPDSERPVLNPIVITRDGGDGRESTDDARARYAALG